MYDHSKCDPADCIHARDAEATAAAERGIEFDDDGEEWLRAGFAALVSIAESLDKIAKVVEGRG